MSVNIRKFATDPMAFFDALVIPSARGTQRLGDCIADFQRERFEGLIPALISIAKGEKPAIGRHWWEATKGASKDSDLAVCLLWLLAFTKRPLTCQVGAADRDQAGEMQKAAKDILRLNEWLAQRVEIQSWKVFCRATGSECEIIAADVAGSHGARPDVLILNELSHVQKQEFAENLFDNAAKVPHGLAVIATNSGFVGTWQETWRKIAETSDRWKMHTYSRPSPWLDDAEIAEAERRNSHSRFMRLWWGIWASSAGDALDEADIAAAIKPDLAPMIGPAQDYFSVAGLDLGIKHDHSALVVLAGNHRTLQIRLAFAQSWKPDPATGKVNLIAVERAVLEASKRFGIKRVGYDPHQAALMAQRLELQRVPMHEVCFTGANLNLMASTMLDVFRSRRIELYNHPAIIADLSRLTIEERSYGYRLSAISNESGHADLAVALSIALPLTVDRLSKPTIMIGQDLFGVDGRNAFERELARHERRAEKYAREMNALAAGNANLDGQEEFAAIMRTLGRR